METQYIHGYSTTEQKRLLGQASFLSEYIFRNIDLTNCQHLLEVGVGVGAQTILLLEKFPHLHITGVELSEVQLAQAKKNLAMYPQFAKRYEIIQADAKKLDNLDTTGIDAVLFIWVLEHIPQPKEVLAEIRRVLPTNSLISITEVFNDSLFLYPPCPAVTNYWRNSIDFQYSIHGDPDVGARLGVLLSDTGYRDIQVTPCVIHLDKRWPQQRLTFLQYWKDLMYSHLHSMIEAGYTTFSEWEKVAAEMDILMENTEAVFYYNPMQAIAKI